VSKLKHGLANVMDGTHRTCPCPDRDRPAVRVGAVGCDPQNIPISLAPGHVKTPEFEINLESSFWVSIEVERKFDYAGVPWSQPRIIGLNIRDRSSIALSLRRGRFQLRIVSRMVFAALFATPGLKLMKNFPLRFFDLLG